MKIKKNEVRPHAAHGRSCAVVDMRLCPFALFADEGSAPPVTVVCDGAVLVQHYIVDARLLPGCCHDDRGWHEQVGPADLPTGAGIAGQQQRPSLVLDRQYLGRKPDGCLYMLLGYKHYKHYKH